MAEVSVAILGLGRLGTSIGLALKRYNDQGKQHQFKISGYDGTSSIAKNAQKIGAVDTTFGRPEMAAKDKDIVVIALPYADVESAYDFIAPSLRAGVVVLDSSPLCQTSLEYAKKYLSEDSHLICIKPIVNPTYLFDGADNHEKASTDYFDNGTMLLMPSVKAIKEAIELAADFGGILGMRVHYADPAEHDGLMVATEAMSSVLGTAYFYAMVNSRGWGDTQRMTNPAFAMLTHKLYDTHPDDLRDLWMNSDVGLVHHIDSTIEQLRELRTAIASKDRDAIEFVLEKSSREYEGWYNRRFNNRWQDDEQLESQAPTAGSMMGNMMGGLFGGFRRGDKNDDD